jgi:hypothetical protein
MKLTLTIDETVVEKAREVARRQGTSLDALVADYIERLANQSSGDRLLADFEALWAEPGSSDGKYKFDREELYTERLVRYRRR